MVSEFTGKSAVRLARSAVEAHVRKLPMSDRRLPAGLRKPIGAFVTLNSFPSGDLRGCMGIQIPRGTLGEAIVEVSESVIRDPRFLPVTEEELDRVTVEVSLLTPPKPLRIRYPKDYLTAIEIGRHGLILKVGNRSGTLLPQVPVEAGWSTEEYLSHVSMKAGLLADAWTDEAATLYTFESEIFSEKTPRGAVIRHRLKEKR